MASTGQPETGRGMDTLSKQIEITDHTEAWTYKCCGADDDGGAVMAITKGQALAFRTTDSGSDLSGYVYPSTKEDPNFAGIADEDISLIGSDVNLQGYIVTVVKHGFANYIKANGALINGDRLMLSGPTGVVLADAAGHYGTVVKYPGYFHEHHICTAAEHTAEAFALKLKASAILGVWNETQDKHIVIAPALHVDAALYGHLESDQKTIGLFHDDITDADHIEVDYIIDPRYIIGIAEMPAADNARTQVNLVSKGV
jgi:hypothetical protein